MTMTATTVAASLEDRINEAGGATQLLGNSPVAYAPFPIKAEYTNWRDEQYAWSHTAILFDQSFHMSDIYLRGKDVTRLLSDVGVNSFATWGRGKAKHFIACNEHGQVISDAILFGLSDDEVSIVGRPIVPNWIEYQAEVGGYDVELTRDERSLDNSRSRLAFRFQIQGPNALKIVEKAHGKSLAHIPFFNIGFFDIAGVQVKALNHTMTGIPGQEHTGLEIIGAFAEADKAKEALLEAGIEYGLRQGGAISYGSTPLETGWIATPLPAIYDDENLRAYREWLPATCAEARLSLGGSFESEDVADYYTTPWDLGYGRLIKFDHDFIGRNALEELVEQPHRRKVWLRWRDEDVTKALASNLFDEPSERAARLVAPQTSFSATHRDKVLQHDELVGLSVTAGYTVNVRGWFSIAMVDETAVDRSEVSVVWGESDGGASKPWLETHAQVQIRATVHDTPLV
jgi:vanillate/3-O-methylgallate O-demethylase